MRLQAVLLKTLLLIIYFNTFQDKAFVNGFGPRFGANMAKLFKYLFGDNTSESEKLLANLVNLVKIPRGTNEDDKKVSGVTIKGIVASDVNRFTVELIDTSAFIGFHISLRFPEKITVFNSYERKEAEVHYFHHVGTEIVEGWGEEERYEELAIEPGSEFEIIISIITDEEGFEIDINDDFYFYKFRTPIENLIFLRIEGDVSITSVTWNGLTDQ